MPVYELQLKDTKGKTVGSKIVQASSVKSVRAHKSRYVGKGRRIGKIRLTKITNYAKWLKQSRSKRFPHKAKKKTKRSQFSLW